MEPADDITRLISDWQRGDKKAESALFDALYTRLHSIAVQCLKNERAGQTLGPTALVHEAYLRFRALRAHRGNQPRPLSESGRPRDAQRDC